MAYITAEETKQIRQALKEEFGKTIKFSVTTQNNSSVNIKILSSTEIDFRPNPEYDHWGRQGKTYVCPYMDTRAKSALARIEEIAKVAPEGREWYNNSDIMTDYFDVAYYIFVSVSDYGKVYEYTGEEKGHKVVVEDTLYEFESSDDAHFFQREASLLIQEAA